MNTKKFIEEGKAVLGIELGSTRIKAVLIDQNHQPVASGNHSWENRLEDGIWTYSLQDIHEGIQDCYRKLAEDVQQKYGVVLTSLSAIGISAMMHGYLPFDGNGKLLSRFRTWRNTNAAPAAARLSELFQFNIPDRWSGAQLFQSILDKEEHVKDIAYITTLSGYIHWLLTGEKVISIGDASGMFPIDPDTLDFNGHMLTQFDELIEPEGYPWKIRDILPKVLVAGQEAGVLSEEGARFLDPAGNLKPGIVLCPPEGDAQTGMVATNSVAKRTGNISAGTSGFLMAVMEKSMSKMYRAIDIIQTPDGSTVGMIHANTCTSDLDAWVRLFGEFARLSGHEMEPDELYGLLYHEALKGDADCGGLVSYGYYAGEFVTDLPEGRPMFVRKPTDELKLSNFMRAHLYSSVAIIRMGVDIMKKEDMKIDRLTGHGGLFKTKGVGQRIVAGALDIPVSVMETAGEGGAWGIALLAAYLVWHKEQETLPEYLDKQVFKGNAGETVMPVPEDVKGFYQFLKNYISGLDAERAAVNGLN